MPELKKEQWTWENCGGEKKQRTKKKFRGQLGCPMPPIYKNCCSYVHTLSYHAVSTEHENTAAVSLTKSPPLQPRPLGGVTFPADSIAHNTPSPQGRSASTSALSPLSAIHHTLLFCFSFLKHRILFLSFFPCFCCCCSFLQAQG